MSRNCKITKNIDNNTQMFDASFVDNYENLKENDENMNNNKYNISMNKLPIENIKNSNNKQTYFINDNIDNNNISNLNGRKNKNKKNCKNIDNNEPYNNNENIINENRVNMRKNINDNEKSKCRNISCRVKRKKIISIYSSDNLEDNSNEKDEIILFENGLGVNDCFLNCIIQVLFHLEEFKNKLFELDINQNQKNPIFQLYRIFANYKSLSKYNSNNNLSASLLRESLHQTYGTYEKGKCGDPMETISQILELIHNKFFQNSENCINNTNNRNNKKIIFCENELCPSHSNFLLYLKEIKYCPDCKAKNIQLFDKDCFMYSVLSYEILSSVNNESFNNYKYSLFTKLKQLSQSFGDNKIKLEKCKCKEIRTIKRLYLYNRFSPYLMINITWDTDFPKMGDICKIYGLIPIYEDNRNIFKIDYERGKKSEKELVTNYYLYGMILYGQNHYTCFFYNRIINKWSFVDDDRKKNFETYHELINFLIIRRAIPVGIFFYYKNFFNPDSNDKLMLNEEEFEKLYQKSVANDLRDMEEKKNEEMNNENYVNNGNFVNRNNEIDNDDNEGIIKIRRNRKKIVA